MLSIPFIALLFVVAGYLYSIGYFGPLTARVRGLFVKHTRTGNPLVDSVAEHQPGSTQAYQTYLHHVYYAAPIGFLISCLRLTDANLCARHAETHQPPKPASFRRRPSPHTTTPTEVRSAACRSPPLLRVHRVLLRLKDVAPGHPPRACRRRPRWCRARLCLGSAHRHFGDAAVGAVRRCHRRCRRRRDGR